MADYMVTYFMKNYESKYLVRHPSENQNRNPRSVYIVLSYLQANSGLFGVELDENCGIWGGDRANLSVRPPRLKKIQDLVGDYNSSNSVITAVFGIQHQNEIYVLQTVKDWIPGLELGYIYGIPKFGSKTVPLKLIKSFDGPTASKPFVMSAYEKLYVLQAKPQWNYDSFQRYDPLINTWELLQPPPSYYSKIWERNIHSWIAGYLVYDQLILLCLSTRKSLKAIFMAYNIHIGEWFEVVVYGSFPCWEKKALVIDGTAYAVTVEGEVIAFSILIDEDQIYLNKLNLVNDTNTHFPQFCFGNSSQCLTYLDNKEFCLVQSYYDYDEYDVDDEDEEGTDGRQPLFIITFRVEENKIIVLDSKVFLVSINEPNTFLLDICFTPGCEVKDPVDKPVEWFSGPMLPILKVIAGDTSVNAAGLELGQFPAALQIVQFSEDSDVAEISDEATSEYGEIISEEQYKGWRSWILRLRMMGKVAIPLIAIGLTWLQVSKKNRINRAAFFEKETEQSSKIL